MAAQACICGRIDWTRSAGGAAVQGVPERVDCPRKLDQIFTLRARAWKDRVPDFPDIPSWSDEFDENAMHWAFFDHGTPVAAARLTIHSRLNLVPNPEVFAAVLPPDLTGPIAVLTRLVVDQRHRGQGLSTALDHTRIRSARSAGCRCVIGSTFAGQKRLDQMVGYGFQILGEAALYASGPLKIVGESDHAPGGAKRDRLYSPHSLIVGLPL